MHIFSIELFGFTLAPTYYGLMYVLWFVSGYMILKKYYKISGELLDDIMWYVFMWVILGWRFWYALFYNTSNSLSDPLSIIKIWEWGMSFHGGVIGVIIALYVLAKKYSQNPPQSPFVKGGSIRKNMLELSDKLCFVLPLGLWFGRIGNYINGELLGYSGYTGLFAVYKYWVGYFPSPLLEALLEWLILFIILYYIQKNKQFSGQVAAVFLIGYGVFRIFVEVFFRQPDAHIGYVIWPFSLWALLSLVMVVWGCWVYWGRK